MNIIFPFNLEIRNQLEVIQHKQHSYFYILQKLKHYIIVKKSTIAIEIILN